MRGGRGGQRPPARPKGPPNPLQGLEGGGPWPPKPSSLFKFALFDWTKRRSISKVSGNFHDIIYNDVGVNLDVGLNTDFCKVRRHSITYSGNTSLIRDWTGFSN